MEAYPFARDPEGQHPLEVAVEFNEQDAKYE
jgi:hypothetical protein